LKTGGVHRRDQPGADQSYAQLFGRHNHPSLRARSARSNRIGGLA
jgi:hypothetical protein